MKKALAALVVVAVVGGILWWARPRTLPSDVASPEMAPPPSAIVPATPPSPRLQALQWEPRQELPGASSAPEISAECRGLWKSLGALHFGTAFSFAQKGEGLPASDGCNAPTPDLAAAQERYHASCADLAGRYDPSLGEEAWGALVSECYLSAMLYRAGVTDWLTRDKPLSEIDDPRILSDKMAARLFTDPGTAADAADRLLELEPGLDPVAKLGAVARLLDAQQKAAGDYGNSLWNRAEDALAEANRRMPQDPTLKEMDLMSEIARYQDPSRLRSRAEALRESDPNGSDYLMAWVEYKGGNTEKALSYLQEAQRRGAQDPRFAEAIANIRAGKKEAFKSTITFPLDVLAPPPPTGGQG